MLNGIAEIHSNSRSFGVYYSLQKLHVNTTHKLPDGIMYYWIQLHNILTLLLPVSIKILDYEKEATIIHKSTPKPPDPQIQISVWCITLTTSIKTFIVQWQT